MTRIQRQLPCSRLDPAASCGGGASAVPPPPTLLAPHGPHRAAVPTTTFLRSSDAEKRLIQALASTVPTGAPTHVILHAGASYTICRYDQLPRCFDPIALHVVGRPLAPSEHDFAAIPALALLRTEPTRWVRTLGVWSRESYVEIHSTLWRDDTCAVSHHAIANIHVTGPDTRTTVTSSWVSVRLADTAPVALFIECAALARLARRGPGGVRSLHGQLVAHGQHPDTAERHTVMPRVADGDFIAIDATVCTRGHDDTVSIAVPRHWFHGSIDAESRALTFPPATETIQVEIPLSA